MAHERFDHSYKHCKSTDCELKDDCALHLAYIEAIGLKMQNIGTMEHCTDPDTWYTKVSIGEKEKKNTMTHNKGENAALLWREKK